MKRPTTLLYRILLNEGLQVSTAVDVDMRVIARRVESEGMSFLTISLPSLCDALDQGLAQGFITPALFKGFKPWKRGGKLPALLSGFFMKIFDIDGVLLAKPCIDAIRAIRQVTRLFKKVELPCSAARQRRAYERYVDNDTSVIETDQVPGDWIDCFDRVAGILWSELEDLSGSLMGSPGKYGSGATAEHFKRNERYGSRRWTERLEPFFPSSSFLVSRPDLRDILEDVTFDQEHDELPVRVVQVPKTLKTPRTISVEPSHMMLCQQSVCDFLYAVLENDHLGISSIRFSDQTVNRELARIGSIDGSLATIDLSDASDLVSNDLVCRMLRACPTFLGYIQACRSSRARLPDGTVISLKKYASMGSALCFPIESMFFLTVVLTALVKQSGRCPSISSVRRLAKDVAIYGDDIIIPNHTAPVVIETLHAFGLRVNMAKSFLTGSFRESCGGDYYKGHDVTPVYVRRWTDAGGRLSASLLASFVSLSNQFYMKGLWDVSQSIRDALRSRGYLLPRSRTPFGVLTFRSVLFDTDLRWDVKRCAYRVRGYQLSPKRVEDPIRDVSGFIRFSLGPKAVREFRDNLQRLSSDYRAVRSPWERSDLLRGFEANLRELTIEESLAHKAWEGSSKWTEPSLGLLTPSSSIKSYSLRTKSRWVPAFSGWLGASSRKS